MAIDHATILRNHKAAMDAVDDMRNVYRDNLRRAKRNYFTAGVCAGAWLVIIIAVIKRVL